MSNNDQDAKAEIKALQDVADALSALDDAAVTRVLRWAADRFGVNAVVENTTSGGGADELGADGQSVTPAFDDVAELYSAAAPASDPERALVVGYWLQYVEELQEFESQTLNKHLKNMGHGVSNITQALEALKNRRPHLVLQTRKSGTSRQARKKYKLTTSGKRAVEEMLNKAE